MCGVLTEKKVISKLLNWFGTEKIWLWITQKERPLRSKKDLRKDVLKGSEVVVVPPPFFFGFYQWLVRVELLPPTGLQSGTVEGGKKQNKTQILCMIPAHQHEDATGRNPL